MTKTGARDNLRENREKSRDRLSTLREDGGEIMRQAEE